MTMDTKKRPVERSKERSAPPAILYWLLAVAIALLSIRLFLWLLANAGLIAEEDGKVMLVIAVPAALLTIGKMAPGRNRRK